MGDQGKDVISFFDFLEGIQIRWFFAHVIFNFLAGITLENVGWGLALVPLVLSWWAIFQMMKVTYLAADAKLKRYYAFALRPALSLVFTAFSIIEIVRTFQ